MRVRRLAIKDLGALTSMVVEFERFLDQIEGKRRRIDKSGLKTRLRLHGFGRSRFFDGLLAEDKGKAAGYLLYHVGYSTNFYSGTLFVSDLFVRRDYRRKGTGQALMQRAVEIAKRRGCGRIEWTVWNINAAAIAFYLGLGAKPIDDELILGITIAK
jgi:GNAT superfamily N-acetyltransferase